MVRTKAYGFTLIEMLVGLAVSSILGTAFASVVYFQVLTYSNHQEEVDARQSGQTLLNELRAQVRLASFGFTYDAKNQSFPALGACIAPGGMYSFAQTAVPQNNCTSNAAGDSLMLAYGAPYGFACAGYAGPAFSFGTTSASLSPCAWNVPLYLALGEAPDTLDNFCQGGASWYFADGQCAGGSPAGYKTDAVRSYSGSDVRGNGANCWGLEAIEPATPPSCPGGYASGYRLLYANIKSYFTTPASGSTPPQFWREERQINQQSVGPVAMLQGVENFQVRYGIDLSTPLDGRLDPCPSCSLNDPYGSEDGGPYSWCRDARAADLGGPCQLTDTTGATLSTGDLHARVVAVHVSFTMRSSKQHPTTDSGVDADGYKRWYFSALMNVRNRSFS